MTKFEFDYENPSIHPACASFPMMNDNELWELAQDIKENGLIEPIVVHDGQLIDGRNRLAACIRVEVEPRIVQWEGGGSPLQWIISKNIQRRHLTGSQRAVIGFELLPLFEKEAKERQRLSRGRGKKGAQNCSEELGKASEHAAKAVNSSPTYIEQVKRIHAKAPELLEEIKQDYLKIEDALKLSTLPEHFRENVLDDTFYSKKEFKKRIRQAEIEHHADQRKAERLSINLPEDNEVEVWTGDCMELMEQIEPKSIDVAVTSVPYNVGVKYNNYDDNMDEDDYLEWLDQVFEAVNRVLKDDGSFFLNAGAKPQKPLLASRIMEVAASTFCVQNSIIWAKSVTADGNAVGQFRPIRSNRYLTPTHENIFHLTKKGDVEIDRLSIGTPYSDVTGKFRFKTYEDTRCGGTVWVIPHNSIQSRKDKLGHPCPFPVELPERCIRLHGVKAGMMALDPFNGSGSSTAAMTRLGIKGIGIDLSEEYCQTAKARILDEQKQLQEKMATIKMKRVESQDEYQEELVSILEDLMDMGGESSKENVHDILAMYELSGVTDLATAISSLPVELKQYYQSLPEAMGA